jgi:hypothetical protein
MTDVRLKGIVAVWKPDRRFGFIVPDDGGRRGLLQSRHVC